MFSNLLDFNPSSALSESFLYQSEKFSLISYLNTKDGAVCSNLNRVINSTGGIINAGEDLVSRDLEGVDTSNNKPYFFNLANKWGLKDVEVSPGSSGLWRMIFFRKGLTGIDVLVALPSIIFV